jgi:tetratricopeptide (TPR) repeat protein
MNRHQRRANAKLGNRSIDPAAARSLGLGLKCHKAGQLAEAEGCYRRVLAIQPNHPDALQLIGVVAYQIGRYDVAAEWISCAIKQDGNNSAWFSNLGLALERQGKFEESLANYNRALELNPNFVDVHHNRGVVLAEVKKFDGALLSYGRALALSPNLAATLNNRGNLLQELGRAGEALADYDKVLASDPNDADAVNGRGSALQKLNRIHEAEKALRCAILLKPDYAEAYCNLGTVLIDLGSLFEAEAMIRHAVELKPNSTTALCNLGKVLIDLGKSDEAEVVIRRALALKPDYAEAYFYLGAVLIRLGRPDAAAEATRRAIALKPDLAGAHHNLGMALLELGRLTEAREAAEKAIALAPHEPLHFRQLGEVRKYAVSDPYLTALEALSKREASLDIGRQIDLHFALAKAHADVGQMEDEFKRLLAGNKLKRSLIDYDETFVLGEIDRAQQVFTSEFMRASQGASELSSKPVFIVGMPRSGTTLVEQILASHPHVFGAGELKFFELAIGDVRSAMHEAPAYPEIAVHMSGEQFREIGERYLARIQELAPDASHITDKMPANFVFVGLIHFALPNATIIHTVRDPVDTCISCFSKLFMEGNFQTYNLAELGRYYRHYKALMAHWHSVLPPGRILDVKYEDTVSDVEGVARRIVAHCGLPWDQNCLDFHRTERAIRTASAAQVRSPIYASSIGRWRAYQPFLGQLLAELMPPL